MSNAFYPSTAKRRFSLTKECESIFKLSETFFPKTDEPCIKQPKANDFYSQLSAYYTQKNGSNNFMEKISKLNKYFYTCSEKYLNWKASLEKLNDDLYLNLFKQINIYVEEIERLNKKLSTNSNKEYKKKINDLNKEILDKKEKIRNLEGKIQEKNLNEEKLKKEIIYYKDRVTFYKDKIKIGLLMRNHEEGAKNTTRGDVVKSYHYRRYKIYSSKKKHNTIKRFSPSPSPKGELKIRTSISNSTLPFLSIANTTDNYYSQTNNNDWNGGARMVINNERRRHTNEKQNIIYEDNDENINKTVNEGMHRSINGFICNQRISKKLQAKESIVIDSIFNRTQIYDKDKEDSNRFLYLRDNSFQSRIESPKSKELKLFQQSKIIDQNEKPTNNRYENLSTCVSNKKNVFSSTKKSVTVYDLHKKNDKNNNNNKKIPILKTDNSKNYNNTCSNIIKTKAPHLIAKETKTVKNYNQELKSGQNNTFCKSFLRTSVGSKNNIHLSPTAKENNNKGTEKGNNLIKSQDYFSTKNINKSKKNITKNNLNKNVQFKNNIKSATSSDYYKKNKPEQKKGKEKGNEKEKQNLSVEIDRTKETGTNKRKGTIELKNKLPINKDSKNKIQPRNKNSDNCFGQGNNYNRYFVGNTMENNNNNFGNCTTISSSESTNGLMKVNKKEKYSMSGNNETKYELAKILNDMNDDYSNNIDMLKRQEEQIKLMLSFLDLEDHQE